MLGVLLGFRRLWACNLGRYKNASCTTVRRITSGWMQIEWIPSVPICGCHGQPDSGRSVGHGQVPNVAATDRFLKRTSTKIFPQVGLIHGLFSCTSATWPSLSFQQFRKCLRCRVPNRDAFFTAEVRRLKELLDIEVRAGCARSLRGIPSR